LAAAASEIDMSEPYWWLKGAGRLLTGSNDKRRYENGSELWADFIAYVEDVEANPLYEEKVFHSDGKITRANVAKLRPLTLKGFFLHAGFQRQTFENWEKKRDDLKDAIQAIRDAIYTQKFEAASAGLLNPMFISRDLEMAEKVQTTFDMANRLNEPMDLVVDTSNIANLYHPDDLECIGPLYTQDQLEAGAPWTPPADLVAAQ